jgi:hypothetical protein
MRTLVKSGFLALAVAALAASITAARVAPESFSGTASVKRGAASASAPVTITVTRYSSEDEIAGVKKAAREGGAALRKALSALGDAGSIQLGERRTVVKLAAERSTGAGRLITVLTAEPIVFLGAGIPQAKPQAGFEVAIAMLDLDKAGGKGELAPAAKVGIDDGGAITIEDYGATVVWLNDLAVRKAS